MITGHMLDFEMAKRVSRITSDMQKDKSKWLPPSIRLDNGQIVHTYFWYQHFGLVPVEPLNYWQET